MVMNKTYVAWFFAGVATLAGLSGCQSDKEKKPEKAPLRQINVPKFSGDSAYQYVVKQVEFGPRVPNSEAHRKAGDYLVAELSRRGASVIEQKFVATAFDNTRLYLRNIIASFNPSKEKRILLAAHWDTRPFADKDPDQKDAPFDGANDGASGVAVLLELARLFAQQAPDAGIDIILFDGEDWGEKNEMMNQIPEPPGLDSWYCLGSQHWARNKHKPNYQAYYGILLDMVGAKRSHFYREGLSMEYAPRVVELVWNTAARLGFSDYFVKQNVGAIIDDHKYVNEWAKIPMINIVHYHPTLGFFGDYHHTLKDNVDLISAETLEAVGVTLAHVVYEEE